MKLLIISPVRDEEEHIETTLQCMCSQTVRPDLWIIVNDGSRDRTGDIVRKYAETHSFIRLVEVPDRGHRKPGQGVVESFYAGLTQVDYRKYDVIAKFDGDLRFDEDTIEKILQVFMDEPKAGIVGGVRYERKEKDGPFQRLVVSKEHVGGPYKFYRRECFEDIGGLIRRAGWDGVDDIRANMHGWTTGEREHISFIHLKPLGTAKGEGLRRAAAKYGDVNYYMGGYFWYFLLRVISRSLETKNPETGVFMLKGYFKALFAGVQREPREFRVFLKRLQRENFLHRLRMLKSGPGESAVVTEQSS